MCFVFCLKKSCNIISKTIQIERQRRFQNRICKIYYTEKWAIGCLDKKKRTNDSCEKLWFMWKSEGTTRYGNKKETIMHPSAVSYKKQKTKLKITKLKRSFIVSHSSLLSNGISIREYPTTQKKKKS